MVLLMVLDVKVTNLQELVSQFFSHLPHLWVCLKCRIKLCLDGDDQSKVVWTWSETNIMPSFTIQFSIVLEINVFLTYPIFKCLDFCWKDWFMHSLRKGFSSPWKNSSLGFWILLCGKFFIYSLDTIIFYTFIPKQVRSAMSR